MVEQDDEQQQPASRIDESARVKMGDGSGQANELMRTPAAGLNDASAALDTSAPARSTTPGVVLAASDSHQADDWTLALGSDASIDAGAEALITAAALNAMHSAAVAAAAAAESSSPSPSAPRSPLGLTQTRTQLEDSIAASTTADERRTISRSDGHNSTLAIQDSRMDGLPQVAAAATAATAGVNMDVLAAFAAEDEYLNLNGDVMADSSRPVTSITVTPSSGSSLPISADPRPTGASTTPRRIDFESSDLQPHSLAPRTATEGAKHSQDTATPWYVAAAHAPPPPPAPLALAGLGKGAKDPTSAAQHTAKARSGGLYAATAEDPTAVRSSSSTTPVNTSPPRKQARRENALPTSESSRSRTKSDAEAAQSSTSLSAAGTATSRRSGSRPSNSRNSGRSSSGKRRSQAAAGRAANGMGDDDDYDDGDDDSVSEVETAPAHYELAAKRYEGMLEEQKRFEQTRLRQLLEERLQEGNQGSRHIRVTRQYFITDPNSVLVLHPEPCASCTKARTHASCIVAVGRVKCAPCTSKGESCSLGSLRSSAKRKRQAAEEKQERRRRDDVAAQWEGLKVELAGEARRKGDEAFAVKIQERIDEVLAATFNGLI